MSHELAEPDALHEDPNPNAAQKAFWSLTEALAWIMFRTPAALERILPDDVAGIVALSLESPAAEMSFRQAKAALLDALQRGWIEATGIIDSGTRRRVEQASLWVDLDFYFDPDKPSFAGPRSGGPDAPLIRHLQFGATAVRTRWPAREIEESPWMKERAMPLYVIVALALRMPVPSRPNVITGNGVRMFRRLTAAFARSDKGENLPPLLKTAIQRADLRRYAEAEAEADIIALCDRWDGEIGTGGIAQPLTVVPARDERAAVPEPPKVGRPTRSKYETVIGSMKQLIAAEIEAGRTPPTPNEAARKIYANDPTCWDRNSGPTTLDNFIKAAADRYKTENPDCPAVSRAAEEHRQRGWP